MFVEDPTKVFAWVSKESIALNENPFSLRCVNECFFKVDISRNARLQIGHLNGFSPVWIIMCRFRFELLPNDRLQYEQINERLLLPSKRGSWADWFVTVWTFLAASLFSHTTHFMEFLLMGRFWWQLGQLNNFSPLWIFRCFFKSENSRNRWPHTSHLNGFSPAQNDFEYFKHFSF